MKQDITNIQALIGSSLKIAEPIIKSLEDGKVTWMEGIGIASVLPFHLPNIVRTAPKFWEEYKDLDETEKAQVKAGFKNGFDIPDDKTEAKIEATFDLIINVGPHIAQYIAIIKS